MSRPVPARFGSTGTVHDSKRGRLGLRGVFALSVTVFLPACGGEEAPRHTIIPLPESVAWTPSDTFHVDSTTVIVHDPGDEEGRRVAEQLAALIGNSTETTPAVEERSGAATGAIVITREGADASLGDEGYELTATSDRLTIGAPGGAGLFYGAQTLRHLLPPYVEYEGAYPLPLFVEGVHVVDRPRFEWRGMMLDVSRHFLEVEDVERFIEHISLYKMNRLHIHLSDDQGWRIEIPSWPRLTEYGGQTEVGGRPGGFYSTEDIARLVAFAADRYVTLVPEIDMPGHINAATAAYGELRCDDQPTELYTGTEVGFSALCVEKEVVYDFLDDVIGEIATQMPGPYFHVGGDEVRTLEEEQYIDFIERAQEIVLSHGKRMVGWDEIALAEVAPGTVVQVWRPYWPVAGLELDSAGMVRGEEYKESILHAIDRGAQVIMAPADRYYLDMKYDTTTVLGLTWAGIPDVREAYDFHIFETYEGMPEDAVIGVEAPLWSETLVKVEDFEYLAFPRVVGVAEVGWTAADARSWDSYRLRVGAQSSRWTALGINFYRSPLVPWQVGPADP